MPPYLVATLIAALVMTAVNLGLPGRRGLCFVSAALLTPAAVMAVTYDGYWTPERLGGGALGPADALYCYAAGHLTWRLADVLPASRRLRAGPALPGAPLRALALAATVTAPYLAALVAGIDAITATLIGLGLGLAVTLVWRPALWPLAIPAALAYPICHCAALALAFRFWPDLPAAWQQTTIWGRPAWLGVPLGEYAFHAALGAAWPPMVALIADLRPADAAGRRPGVGP